MLLYRDDPVLCFRRVFGMQHVWPKMREIVESVRDNQFTAVPAGHGVSKTYTAARIGVWFKWVYQPSTVITTAPSDNQVRNQLWREMRACYAGSRVPLGGRMNVLQWDLKPSRGILAELDPEEREKWELNFAMGFSTTPDSVSENVSRIQGWHNKWLLVILDEAGGIHPMVWKTVLVSLMNNERCKILAIGNTTDPYSEFARVCKNKRWNVIPISVRDTPNYKHNREIIPNVSGREQERLIVEEYGEYSNEHKVRCLGEFPEYMQGVVYGPQLAEYRSHFREMEWDRQSPVLTIGDYGDVYTAIGFWQVVKDQFRMIDYFYDDVGMGVSEICKMFDQKPYVYHKDQGHWLPPDYHPEHGSNRKSLATGKSYINEFAAYGIRMHVCTPHSFHDGVSNVRSTFQTMWINSLRCKDFWDSLNQYKYKKNVAYSTDSKPAYHKDPEPSPHTHPADMLRYSAWIYRFQLRIGGELIGSPMPLPPSGRQDSGVYDDDLYGWEKSGSTHF